MLTSWPVVVLELARPPKLQACSVPSRQPRLRGIHGAVPGEQHHQLGASRCFHLPTYNLIDNIRTVYKFTLCVFHSWKDVIFYPPNPTQHLGQIADRVCSISGTASEAQSQRRPEAAAVVIVADRLCKLSQKVYFEPCLSASMLFSAWRVIRSNLIADQARGFCFSLCFPFIFLSKLAM